MHSTWAPTGLQQVPGLLAFFKGVKEPMSVAESNLPRDLH